MSQFKDWDVEVTAYHPSEERDHYLEEASTQGFLKSSKQVTWNPWRFFERRKKPNTPAMQIELHEGVGSAPSPVHHIDRRQRVSKSHMIHF